MICRDTVSFRKKPSFIHFTLVGIYEYRTPSGSATLPAFKYNEIFFRQIGSTVRCKIY